MSRNYLNGSIDNGFGYRQDRFVVNGRPGACAVATTRHQALWHHLWALVSDWAAMKRSPKQTRPRAVEVVGVRTSTRSGRAAAIMPRGASGGISERTS